MDSLNNHVQIIETLLLAAKKQAEETFDLPQNQWINISFPEMTDGQKDKFFELFNKTHGDVSNLFTNINMFAKHKLLLCDTDGDGIPNAFIIYKPVRRFGNNILLTGTDKSSGAGTALSTYKINLLKTPGWYCEAGGKQAQALEAAGVQPVTNKALVAKILGVKDIEWMDGKYYRRNLAGSGEVTKALYGMPITSHK